MMDINGYELNKTCGCCPEQYDVYKDGEQVCYLRLRHGYFRGEYPYVGGKEVYSANTEGDGMFDDSERELHLTNAIEALDKEINNKEGLSNEKQ
jgi:hypothetical protein